MKVRSLVVGLLSVTVIAPILFYTDPFITAVHSSFSTRSEFLQDVTAFSLPSDARQPQHLNVLPQESSTVVKEPLGIVHSDNTSTLSLKDSAPVVDGRELNSARVLSATNDVDNTIRQVVHNSTIHLKQTKVDDHGSKQQSAWMPSKVDQKDASKMKINKPAEQTALPDSRVQSARMPSKVGQTDASKMKINKPAEQRALLDSRGQSARMPSKVGQKDASKMKINKPTEQTALPDSRVRQLRDLLIRAKVYLSLPAMKSSPHFIRELRSRIKEVQRVLGDATRDSELPNNSNDKFKAMDLLLAKGKQMQDDCALAVKKLRAMVHATEEQLRVHKKQNMFLTQLTAKTIPKGLHCLPLRLTSEYYSLNSSEQQFPHEKKFQDSRLYHYALFSDNVLAAAVVINSTVSNAKDPSKHVFHIVTDRLNYAAMRMWFLANPPGKAAIQVQNIEEFTWLNSSYSPVLKQLGSQSMINYYFRAHRANSDSNLKYRNPKYLSILNHLRFYLPEIFPKLNKVLFLDDDLVVQKDLTALWSVDMKGNVNGAVETCRENFHRFDRYLNFSNPIISKNFDPRACGWAYGMNIFDLQEWRRQNITEVYHTWQRLNHDRLLWKLGTLPPGLITFWKRTYPLEHSWHVLGLGYNPTVSQREIEHAAVIHYNGNMKPWLDIGIPKYRNHWAKYVDYDNAYLRDCNINP